MVRRSDANDNACLSDRQRADAVDNGDVVDAPTFPDLVADLGHGELGGWRIRLVFEMRHLPTAAMIADSPDEGRDGAGTRVSNQRLCESGIERLRLNAKPRVTTTTHGGYQRQLVAIV